MSESIDTATGEISTLGATLTFSEDRDTILSTLLEVKKEIGTEALKKNARNDHHGNSYADINAVLERVEPTLMAKECLSMTSSRIDFGRLVVFVDTQIIHIPTKEWVMRTIAFKPSKMDPQGIASCESYGRRYNHTGLFNLRSEDDDGNAASLSKSVNGDSGKTRPPSDKALKLATDMATERGIPVPEAAKKDAKACSTFIDEVKAGKHGNDKGASKGKAQGQAKSQSEANSAGSDSSKPPSARALEYAKTLAAERGVEVPAGVDKDAKACSKFIDEVKDKPVVSDNTTDGSEADEQLSDACKQALGYVNAAALDELDRAVKHTKGHKAMVDAEKKRVLKAIEDRRNELTAGAQQNVA